MNGFSLAASVLFAAIVTVPPASAQQAPSPRPARPYQGLFGGGVSDADQLLTLRGDIGGGYSSDLLAERSGGVSGELIGARPVRGGTFGDVSGELAYFISRPRIDFGASIASSARYYNDLADGLVPSHGAGAGVSLRLTDGTVVRSDQSLAYQPFYVLPALTAVAETPLGVAVAPEHDFGLGYEDYMIHASHVELTQALSRRTSFIGDYGYTRAHFGSAQRNFALHNAGARLSHFLTRNLAAYGGYRYFDGSLGSNAANHNVKRQGIDVGLNFAHAFSLTRRMTLSFGAGAATVGDALGSQYFITGNALLNREIGRTWNAALAYTRDTRFVEVFDGPLFYDSLTLSVTGLITRRLQFQSAAAASFGTVGVAAEDGRLDTYNATVGVLTAVTRQLAVGVDYTYFHYSVAGEAARVFRTVDDLDRQSLRAYLSVWVPLIHR